MLNVIDATNIHESQKLAVVNSHMKMGNMLFTVIKLFFNIAGRLSKLKF